MMTRYQQIQGAIDFHHFDIDATRADLGELRRRRAATADAFKTLRQQIDSFEQAILRDYSALETRVVERLDRMGEPAPAEQDDEPLAPSNVVSLPGAAG